MRMLSSVVLVLLAALPGLTLRAQEQEPGPCQLTDSIEDCFDRFLKDGEEVKRAAAAQEKRDLESQPTGTDTGGANLSSNTKDLLPLLALTGLVGEGSVAGGEGTLALDLNFLLPALGPKDSKNVQLQAVVNSEPEVSEAVRNALPEGDREELIEQLQRRVGGFDDYELSFTYNLTSRSYGRGFGQYARRFDALASTAIEPLGPPPTINALTDLIAEFPDEFGEDAEEKRFQDLPEPAQSRALEVAETRARSLATFEAEGTSALGAAGLDKFHLLIDNQPQLHARVAQKVREPLIGADELGVKVTYEWSNINFNAAMSNECHRALDVERPTTNSDCLAQYTRFVDDHAEGIDKGNRFSFSGEYLDIDEETIDLGLDGVEPVALEAVRKLILSIGWSRDFILADGEPVTLDLVGDYEDVSDDPLRQDRGVVTLTITRRLGDISVPLGIVYANHGEYLTEVDEKLSAHVGLKFNGFDKD